MPTRFKQLSDVRCAHYRTLRPQAGLAGLAAALAYALEQLELEQPEGHTLERITLARDNPDKRDRGNRYHLAAYFHRRGGAEGA